MNKKKVIEKFLEEMRTFRKTIEYRIMQEREMIAEHEENIRSLESQRRK